MQFGVFRGRLSALVARAHSEAIVEPCSDKVVVAAHLAERSPVEMRAVETHQEMGDDQRFKMALEYLCVDAH